MRCNSVLPFNNHFHCFLAFCNQISWKLTKHGNCYTLKTINVHWKLFIHNILLESQFLNYAAQIAIMVLKVAFLNTTKKRNAQWGIMKKKYLQCETSKLESSTVYQKGPLIIKYELILTQTQYIRWQVGSNLWGNYR